MWESSLSHRGTELSVFRQHSGTTSVPLEKAKFKQIHPLPVRSSIPSSREEVPFGRRPQRIIIHRPATPLFIPPSLLALLPLPSALPPSLSDVESAAVHSKQQVMDFARGPDLAVDEPARRCPRRRSDGYREASCNNTHFVTVGFLFSLSLFLSCKDPVFSAVPTPPATSVFKRRKQPKVRRGLSGRSGCSLFNPSSVAQANSLPSHFDLIFFFFFFFFFIPEFRRGLKITSLSVLKIINCPNRDVIAVASGS